MADVRTVEVSAGFKKPVAKSVAIAGSLGAVVFGGFAYLTGDDGGSCANGSFCVRLSRKRKTVAGVIAGTVIGAAGGLVHGLTQQVEVWQSWPNLPAGFELHPAVTLDGGLGAKIVLRF